MGFETVLLEKADGVAKITLNRPQVLNALNSQVTAELVEAIEDVAKDDSSRVLVLTGAGRAFSAGADTGGRGSGGNWGTSGAEASRQNLRNGFQKFIRALHYLEKPSIAMVNGVAVGAGFDLALACDLRIGSEKTRFMVAFVRLGLFPGTGGSWFMPRLMGVSKALEMLYTADFVEGADAEKCGLLTRFVPSEKLEEETMALAKRIAAGPPISQRLSKLLVYKSLTADFETGMELAAVGETITLTSEDHQEGMAAYREKRAPAFKGR